MLGEILLVLGLFTVVAIAILVGIVWLTIQVWRSKLTRVVAKVNLECGTDFVVSPVTVMGSWVGKALVFDPKNRKLMFYFNGRYTLHEYGYIQRWSLHWIENTGPAGSIIHKGVRIEIETNDLERPLQSFPMASKSQGDAWSRRLDLLLIG